MKRLPKNMQTKTIIVLLTLLFIPLLSNADCPIPTPPPTPILTVLSPYEVRFQVPPAQAPATGFYAEREPQGGTFTVVNSGYPNGVFIDDQMLLPNHTFCYRTRAKTACGARSEPTDEVMVTLPDGPMPYQGGPQAPSGLQASMVGSQVYLRWTLGAFPAVPGQTQSSQVGKSTDGGATWSKLAMLGNSRSSTYDANVAPGHTYLYRVRCFDTFGWGPPGYYGGCGITRQDCGTAWSNVVSFYVPYPSPSPTPTP